MNSVIYCDRCGGDINSQEDFYRVSADIAYVDFCEECFREEVNIFTKFEEATGEDTDSLAVSIIGSKYVYNV